MAKTEGGRGKRKSRKKERRKGGKTKEKETEEGKDDGGKEGGRKIEDMGQRRRGRGQEAGTGKIL